MGRDRDPFDRTIAFVRERVATLAPLQGAMIPINSLAKTLDISQTPVREALATLAGEGLIVRTAAGYAGVTHDPTTLAALYDLAEVQVMRAVGALDGTCIDLADATSFDAGLEQIVAEAGHVALKEAYRRLAGQLGPFTAAADKALGDGDAALANLVGAFATINRRQRGLAVRTPLQRRKRSAGRILAVALGLNGGR